tara:strand:+ start:1901 stop:2266 length:366 start_codon:yes stop_codon:yes gene_type:complete
MAKEITASVALSVVSALGIKADRSDSASIDMSGDSIHHGITSVGDSGTALEHAELLAEDTVGWVFLKNLSTTVTATIGTHATSNHVIQLKPGEFALFRANGDLFGDTASGTALIEWLTIDD